MMADIEKGPEIDGITGESYPPQQSVQQLWIGLAGKYVSCCMKRIHVGEGKSKELKFSSHFTTNTLVAT